MNDFDYDVYLKKRIARGYRSKKNGSKSKRCSLTSDGMTQKQWKERNGTIMSYNLSSPMSWDRFKAMPDDLQREYITSLRDKYSTTATDLARFFGCVPSTITKYCKSILGITFNPGKRMTKEQRNAFREFTGDDEEGGKQDALAEERICDSLSSQASLTPNKPETETLEDHINDFHMKEISMSFSGNFDVNAIRNSLAVTIGNGRPVHIEIKCTILN